MLKLGQTPRLWGAGRRALWFGAFVSVFASACALRSGVPIALVLLGGAGLAYLLRRRKAPAAHIPIAGPAERSQLQRAQEALRDAHDELERRVAWRTAELSESNERLQREAIERQRAEEALRNSEERLREQFAELEQIYRTAPIGLALHDRSLRWVRINERLAAIDGLPVEAHIGRTLQEVIPDIAQIVAPILEKVLDSGEPVLDLEIQGTTPAEPNVRRSWIASYYPLKAADGRVLGVSAIIQDISERAWAEERARRHLDDLAHVSRLSTMGEMAAGLAHELNQPLAAMANFAFVGLRTLDGEQSPRADALRSVFTELSDQALRAGDIVEHVRAFTRKAHPPRALVGLNELIGDVLRLVDSEMRLNGVRPEVRLDGHIGSINADAIQIQQVLLNLLRNALEAMETTEPRSRRLVITSSQPAGAIEVQVADTGQGVSGGDTEKLFDAFFTTKTDGMGMGLAISRSIIEDHGGRLWAEVAPGGGAVFRFTLPPAKEARDRAN